MIRDWYLFQRKPPRSLVSLSAGLIPSTYAPSNSTKVRKSRIRHGMRQKETRLAHSSDDSHIWDEDLKREGKFVYFQRKKQAIRMAAKVALAKLSGMK